MPVFMNFDEFSENLKQALPIPKKIAAVLCSNFVINFIQILEHICPIGKDPKIITNVSFAFTHTYTLEKLTFLDFFPQRTWKILKNAQKRQKKVGEGGGGAITAPCDQDTTLYGSKPLLVTVNFFPPKPTMA